jgi:hypothetical protein
MTSAVINLFLLLGLSMLALVVFGGIALFILPNRALKRRRARLKAMSVSALAEEALQAATDAGIREHFTEAPLFTSQGGWESSSLLAALHDLHKRLDEEDRRAKLSGRDSWVFRCCDVGMAGIWEVLEETAPP